MRSAGHNAKSHDERLKFAKSLQTWQEKRELNNAEAARKLNLSEGAYWSYVNGITRPKNAEKFLEKMK